MKSLTSGVFITVEGIDGSGKTTLTKNLYKYFIDQNFPVIMTKEPSETAIGQQIRSFFKEDNKVSNKAEYLLFAADRAEHFNEIVIPNLNAKKIIISDRSGYSSLAYQGYGHGLDLNMIKQINNWVMNNIEPDYIFYLKIDVTTALERISKRMGEISKFENLEFLKKVSKGFDIIFNDKKNVIVLDATKSSEELFNSAIENIKAIYGNQNF